MAHRELVRAKAVDDLKRFEVLMLDGHFDYGNGYHGRVYVNPHRLFRYPSTIWRFAQDLLDVVPAVVVDETELVAGPVTGGALLAHTIAGLLDSRRSLSTPPTMFAPFHLDAEGRHGLRTFYHELIRGKRVLIADDVRNTGETLARCTELVRDAGGTVLATVSIYDRGEAGGGPDRPPHVSLAEYTAPSNYRAEECPLCRDGVAITRF